MKFRNYIKEGIRTANVYKNNKGEHAYVFPNWQKGKGYWIEFDNKDKIGVKNRKELEKWRKKGKWEWSGTEEDM